MSVELTKITERIDKITCLDSDRTRRVVPAPKSVKIELTSKCNYRCSFCAHRHKKTPSQDMDFDLFKRITKEMQEAGVKEIGLFYIGEPFASPKLLVDAIRYLKQELSFPFVFLTSNASLATPQLVEECMAAGLDSLKWSCNADGGKQFAEMMGVPDKMFAQSLNNIRIAWKIRKKKGYKTGLYASSIHYDTDQHEKMKSMLTTFVLPYVDEHYWLPLYSMGDQAAAREQELGFKPTAGNQGRIDALRHPLPCWCVFTAGHVLSNGTMSACSFDASDDWIMGDLKKHSFMKVWNCRAYRNLRKAHIKKNVKGTACEKCAAYK
jgi:radical SAM protein with 4Fe4S-binding SPASM domain